MRLNLLGSLLIVAGVLSACGGGGGGAAAPVASTSAFPLNTIWTNVYTTAASNNYTISGTVNGVSVTGSGTATFGNVSAGTFESIAGFQRTTTATGNVVANGTTTPLNSSSIDWTDTNYAPTGESGGTDYVVVTGTPTIPANVHVNDTGSLYTANRYSDNSKTGFRGTKTVTYVVEADTATTALITLISVEKNSFGSTTATNSSQVRVTPAGAFTRVKETLVESDTALTVQY